MLWCVLSQNPINRDIPRTANLRFWDIFPEFIKLNISEVFHSPTDFTGHELRSNVPGLVPSLWALAVRGLFCAQKAGLFSKEFTVIK